MRKIAMITTALMGLAFAEPELCPRQNQSAPVSGLPPGAAAGAMNAQPPAATGDIATTRVGPATVSSHGSPSQLWHGRSPSPPFAIGSSTVVPARRPRLLPLAPAAQ